MTRKKEDIDKTIAGIALFIELWPKLKKLKEADKWYTKVFTAAGILFGKFKALLSFGKSLPEVGMEIIDIDAQEAEEIFDALSQEFGGTPEIKEAIKKIVIGAGYLNQGIPELIDELKKDKKE